MVVTCMEPELGGEQRVPPLTSVPTQDLAGGGAGEESGGCTSPSGLVLEDSRGTRKRELATVELQEADSTVEGAEVGRVHLCCMPTTCTCGGLCTSVCVCVGAFVG